MDVLSKQDICKFLNHSDDTNIIIHDCVESTNDIARLLGAQGAEQGTVIIANQQTMGRGRFAKCFFSPPDSGLYLSIVLRPEFDISKSVYVTMAAGVAVVDAIRLSCNIEPRLKWINDVMLNDKKICGILAESRIKSSDGRPEFIVLGIGLNVIKPKGGYLTELEHIAGAVCSDGQEVDRNKLAALIIDNVLDKVTDIDVDQILKDFKDRLGTIGKRVVMVKEGVTLEGIAVDVDSTGGLIVKGDDGTMHCLEHINSSIVELDNENISE